MDNENHSRSLPAVSICTITHNRRHLLPLLMTCVIGQDYPADRLEWVVVDDSTTGDPPDFSAAQQEGISVVYVQLDTRLPIGAKRNLCHERSRGEVLVLMDDDDYYPSCRVSEAVAALGEDVPVVGSSRIPMLLLPEGSRWLTPFYGPTRATASTLSYLRSYLEAGHRFDPVAEKGEEAPFLAEFSTPLRQLDPFRTLTCIGHGSNTIDKRLWIAKSRAQGFERLPENAAGFPPEDYLRRYRQALGMPEPDQSQISTTSAPAPEQPWRVAVVTPYHDEPVELLRRCHVSVEAQTVPCTHFLVADGSGHPEVAGWECRHLVLGVGHGDSGNTPRSLGALAAMNEGFTAIAFLDAQDWLTDDHLELAIGRQHQGELGVVFARRHVVFPHGQRLICQPEEEQAPRHGGTSGLVVFEEAFACLPLWAQMPAAFASQGDRVAFTHLMASQRCGWSERPTLFYETWNWRHFLSAGLLPPANAHYLHRVSEQAWATATDQFRQRSVSPVYIGREGIGPDKPRLNLVTILGPACSGGTLLQAGLCRHLTFYGIPENHFLFHFISCFGVDPVVRRDGDELRQALAEYRPEHARVKPFDLQPRGLERAIKPGRSYTLLEAWFRVVQALTPKEAMEFSRSFGYVNILERSCTLPLVADVLFNVLPQHQAVLMVRDPLEQIAAVRRMMARYPEPWGLSLATLQQLSLAYLEGLARPLTAAPEGQLKVVYHRKLLQEPEAVLDEVCGFLGLETNHLLALEPLDLGVNHHLNSSYAEDYEAIVAALPGQLLHHEPWKMNCFAADPAQAEERLDVLEGLAAGEMTDLREVFMPLRTVIAEHTGVLTTTCGEREETPPEHDQEQWNPIRSLAQQVADDLIRHYAATAPAHG